MSYLVFARKWRPKTFDDVIGQAHITDTLKKAIEKNRIAHAYIFSGTRGVGKTTTARILARALNCEKGPTATPCGTCESCKGIISGSSFDVLEIDGASNNSVDDIRELRENVGYSSMGGKYRIYVIDEVHMLSKPAFNALLKTLEEPPPNVIFIFATTEPQKIPATIHSRCQRYDFRRIVPELILERLAYICGEEKIDYEKSVLALIASKADGSMRDALSLLDQVCSYCQGKLTEQEVRLVLGLVGVEVYTRIMDAVAAKSPASALAAIQQVLYEGYDLHEFVTGFEEHVRTLLFVRIDGAFQNAGIAMGPEAALDLRRSSERFTEGDLLRMMEIIRRAESELKWSALPRFAVEMMILKLVFLDSTVSLEHMLALLGKTKEDEGKQIAPAVAPVKENKSSDSSEAFRPVTEVKSPASLSKDQQAVLRNNTVIPNKAFTGNNSIISGREAFRPVKENKSIDSPEVFSADIKKKPEVIPASPLPRTRNEVNQAAAPSSDDGAAPESCGAADDEEEGVENFDDLAPAEGAGADIMRKWRDFIDLLMRDRPHIGTFLSLATAAGITNSSIDLVYPHNLAFQFGEVSKKQHREEIGKMLQAFMGRPVEVHLTLEAKKAEKAEPNYIKPAAHAVAIESDIEHEPIIRSVLDIFDGEVLK